MQVQKIQCARVYHINVVLRIRTSLQDTRKDQAYKEKSLQIQRSVATLIIIATVSEQSCLCHLGTVLWISTHAQASFFIM